MRYRANNLEVLLKDVGFEVKKKINRPPRFEVKIGEKIFTVVRKSLLDDLPSQIDFEVGYLIGFNGIIKK